MFSLKDRCRGRSRRYGAGPALRKTRLAVEQLEDHNAPGALYGFDAMDLGIVGADAADAFLAGDANTQFVRPNEGRLADASGTPTGKPVSAGQQPADGLLAGNDRTQPSNGRVAGPISVVGDEGRDGLSSVVSIRPSAAPPPAAGTQMHVDSISIRTGGFSFGTKIAYVDVKITDEFGKTVDGAVVTGDWSGCFKITGASATTGSRLGVPSGVARVSGGSCRPREDHPSESCEMTFTVTSVSKAGYSYDPLANVETSDSSPCQ